jgi:putative N6-adenine-specific DNA methylase
LEKNTYVVKTLHGFETILEEELHAMGATEIEPLKRAVSFVGDKELLYRANYSLRTALRILMPIHAFSARDEKQFYARIHDEIDWAQYMDVTETLAVDATVMSRTFTHSQYMALTTKDAIVDQFRRRFGRRPNVDIENPHLRVSIRIHENHCDIFLDSSGDSLHKRGYKKEATEAPINEVLAAGMVQLSGWTGASDFVDPMCGSATLPIEAAHLAKQVPAQMYREKFGFQNWRDFDGDLFEKVKNEENAKIKPLECKIFAFDKDARAHGIATRNISSAGLAQDIQIKRADFETLEAPDAKGVLMFNPPYNERLHLAQMEEFYSMIGSRMKHHWPGWKAWIIASNKEAMHHIGLRANRKIQLFNGPLECSFQKYELFEGKKGHNKV